MYADIPSSSRVLKAEEFSYPNPFRPFLTTAPKAIGNEEGETRTTGHLYRLHYLHKSTCVLFTAMIINLLLQVSTSP